MSTHHRHTSAAKHPPNRKRLRWKVTAWGLGGLLLGIGLLVGSLMVGAQAREPDGHRSGQTATAPADTQPAPPPVIPSVTQPALPVGTQPATQPATQPTGSEDSRSQQRRAAARSLSGLLLMFAMMSFLVGAICLGWAAVDVYRDKPTWQRQTRYPRRR